MSREPRISIDYEGDCTCPNDHSNGELDEFVASGVDVHFEAMGTAEWWIGITDPTTNRAADDVPFTVNPRARGYALIEQIDTAPSLTPVRGD